MQVDALVKAHLLQVSQQMLGLQAALASAGGCWWGAPWRGRQRLVARQSVCWAASPAAGQAASQGAHSTQCLDPLVPLAPPALCSQAAARAAVLPRHDGRRAGAERHSLCGAVAARQVGRPPAGGGQRPGGGPAAAAGQRRRAARLLVAGAARLGAVRPACLLRSALFAMNLGIATFLPNCPPWYLSVPTLAAPPALAPSPIHLSASVPALRISFAIFCNTTCVMRPNASPAVPVSHFVPWADTRVPCGYLSWHSLLELQALAAWQVTSGGAAAQGTLMGLPAEERPHRRPHRVWATGSQPAPVEALRCALPATPHQCTPAHALPGPPSRSTGCATRTCAQAAASSMLGSATCPPEGRLATRSLPARMPIYTGTTSHAGAAERA